MTTESRIKADQERYRLAPELKVRMRTESDNVLAEAFSEYHESFRNLVLFRMDRRSPAKHLAILATTGESETIIHAYSGRSVIESPLGNSWRRRVFAAFRFPTKA